jgi:hypothetical protein
MNAIQPMLPALLLLVFILQQKNFIEVKELEHNHVNVLGYRVGWTLV